MLTKNSHMQLNTQKNVRFHLIEFSGEFIGLNVKAKGVYRGVETDIELASGNKSGSGSIFKSST